MFKQEKGITLVSLVITIIVMLILAAVSLSMVVGEGSILNRAQGAVDATELATVRDEIDIALASAQAAYYSQYANTTAPTPMADIIKGLALKEFTSAASVHVSPTADQIVYQLPNGNVYTVGLTVTSNSVKIATPVAKAEAAVSTTGYTQLH